MHFRRVKTAFGTCSSGLLRITIQFSTTLFLNSVNSQRLILEIRNHVSEHLTLSPQLADGQIRLVSWSGSHAFVSGYMPAMGDRLPGTPTLGHPAPRSKWKIQQALEYRDPWKCPAICDLRQTRVDFRPANFYSLVIQCSKVVAVATSAESSKGV
jgi:hypothetical protein